QASHAHSSAKARSPDGPAPRGIRDVPRADQGNGPGDWVMPVDFDTLLFLPNFDMFARPIVVTPVASQPGQPAYDVRDDTGGPLRGIFCTRALDVLGLDGLITSDQKTEMDIRNVEFAVVPIQMDQINIPAIDNMPSLGDWEIIDADDDGEGCTVLSLRKIESPSLP